MDKERSVQKTRLTGGEMRIRLTSECAEQLMDDLEEYVRAVDSSGKGVDAFEAVIEFPTKLPADAKPYNECRVKLCFANAFTASI